MKGGKEIIYGVVGMLIGVILTLVVSPQLSASRISRPETATPTTAQTAAPMHHGDGSMSMDQMVQMLVGKSGADFDRAFITGMIEHHQGAIEMARLAEQNATHEEIRTMSGQIVTAQEAEIKQMRTWQQAWGY